MSDQFPVLSNANLTSGKNLKRLAVAVPVAGLVFWLTPWWVIASAVGVGGYSIYRKLGSKPV